MKVLFLDIDGVLNFSSDGEDTYYDKYCKSEVALDQECIKRLKRLVSIFPDLKIVWSTDWRNVKGRCWNKWKNPVKYLEETCLWLAERVIGKTPAKMSSERWHEVKWWLDENLEDVDGYAVLDDIQFPRDWFGIERHCITTSTREGFTEGKLAEAVKILNTRMTAEEKARILSASRHE